LDAQATVDVAAFFDFLTREHFDAHGLILETLSVRVDATDESWSAMRAEGGRVGLRPRRGASSTAQVRCES
jgi:hypothetical protein